MSDKPTSVDYDGDPDDGNPVSERFAWRRKIERNPPLNTAYRVGVAVVGLLIVITGIILLPLPGPGWLIIFLGIGVWASEFDWASRLLRFAKEKVGIWTDWVGRQNWFVRGLVGLAIIVFVLLIFWAMFLVSGVPTFFPDWAKDLLANVPGLG